MAWTAFPTWIVGQISLASDWNTYIAANMNFLATPAMWRVYRASALTLTASSQVIFPYDTVLFDSASGFSTSTHQYTVEIAGYYKVSAQMLTSVTTAARSFLLSAYHNSAEFSRGLEYGTDGGNTPACVVGGAIIGLCAVSDTLEIYYYATSADAITVGAVANWFTGYKVSN
jgi:hypothetical protein